MEKKDAELDLKIADLQSQIRDKDRQIAKLQASIAEYKRKEESISSAIIASMEHANEVEESRKKIYSLDIQRTRLMYLQMERVIHELYAKYPELKKDGKYNDIATKFKRALYSDIEDKEAELSLLSNKKQSLPDDPIKKLLHNIVDCFDTKKLDEDKRTGIPQADLINNVSKSGFDFNEALHPTMGLDEIMKSFNLSDDNKKDKK